MLDPPHHTCYTKTVRKQFLITWIEIDTGGRYASESWIDYVTRSTREVEQKFTKLMQETDFKKEAASWAFSQGKKKDPSFNPLDHLYFVAYFEDEED